MNSVLDAVLVGAVLVAAVLYAVYSLGPRAWRRRFFGTAAAKSKGGCGGCDNCGTEAKAPAQLAMSSEIKVPLSSISKRKS